MPEEQKPEPPVEDTTEAASAENDPDDQIAESVDAKPAPEPEKEHDPQESPPGAQSKSPTQVLILNSPDQKFTNKVLDRIKDLNLDMIFLNGPENAAKPLHAKQLEFSKIPFLIVILSGDILAFDKNAKPSEAKLHADQKVVFEMGFWIATLGRQNIFVLYRELSHFRLPTEYFSAPYHQFDADEKWLRALVKKMQEAGYQISL